jgi:hypothetical protein
MGLDKKKERLVREEVETSARVLRLLCRFAFLAASLACSFIPTKLI